MFSKIVFMCLCFAYVASQARGLPDASEGRSPTSTTRSTTTTECKNPDDTGSGYNDCAPVPKNESKAFNKCKDYQKLFSSYFRNLWKDVITDCGRRTLLIGEAEKSPHMAVLGYGDRDHLCCVCAGTIISEKFILTAGVCTFSREDPLTHVLVGVFKRTDTRNATIYGIKRIINHPAYKWPIKYNDIALLELEVPLTLSKEIFPACLHIGDQVKDDEAYALSWSKTDFDSIVLQKISLSSSGECESIQYRHMPKGLDPNTQLCHAVDSNNLSIDRGDPLLIENQENYCMYTIIGISSFAKNIGYKDQYVFTKIAPYTAWIETVVWPY